MRLLLAAYCCSPSEGSEPWAGWSLATLAATQHEVTVLVEEHKFREAIEAELAKHPQPNLRFEFIPEKWWAHAAWKVGLGYLSYRLWQRRALVHAKRLHEEQPFDAVQASTIITFREPGFWSELNIPVIWGPIGGTANVPKAMLPVASRHRWKERLRSLINTAQLRGRRVRKALRSADLVVAATEETRRDLQSATARRIDVISEIVVPDLVDASADTILDEPVDGPLRILFSGLHEPRKALPLLLDAIAQLSDIDLCLRVLGDGPCRAEWERHAKSLGLVDRLEWTGWVARDNVASHYDWADLFAFPSVRDTTGTVLLEALGRGVPVLGLDHQGVADVVNDTCGLKVPCTTPELTAAALASAIRDLATNRDHLAELAAGTRERADAYRPPAKLAQWAPIWDEAAELATQVPRSVTAVSPLKATLRRAKGSLAAAGAGLAARSLGVREFEAVGIINYHRVGPAGPDLNVTPESFARQIEGLVADGWTGLTVSQVCDAHRDGQPLDRKSFAITFDDAFASVHRFALPILQSLGVPATVYLASRHVGSPQPFPFDPWHGKGVGDPLLWRPIDRSECDNLLDAGWELGVHTATHRDFGRLREAFADDLGESIDWLRANYGIEHPTFSYPYGLVNDHLVAAVERSACRCGLTTESRLVRPGDNPYWWGRFGAEDNETALHLLGRLSGWFEAARGCWRRGSKTPSRQPQLVPAIEQVSP